MTKSWTQTAMELLDGGYVVDHYDYNPRTQQFSGCIIQKTPATYNELQTRGLTLKPDRLIDSKTGLVHITWLIDLKAGLVAEAAPIKKVKKSKTKREEVQNVS